jgi:hypothetical protein
MCHSLSWFQRYEPCACLGTWQWPAKTLQLYSVWGLDSCSL